MTHWHAMGSGSARRAQDIRGGPDPEPQLCFGSRLRRTRHGPADESLTTRSTSQPLRGLPSGAACWELEDPGAIPPRRLRLSLRRSVLEAVWALLLDRSLQILRLARYPQGGQLLLRPVPAGRFRLVPDLTTALLRDPPGGAIARRVVRQSVQGRTVNRCATRPRSMVLICPHWSGSSPRHVARVFGAVSRAELVSGWPGRNLNVPAH